jgi:hypothetical protein
LHPIKRIKVCFHFPFFFFFVHFTYIYSEVYHDTHLEKCQSNVYINFTRAIIFSAIFYNVHFVCLRNAKANINIAESNILVIFFFTITMPPNTALCRLQRCPYERPRGSPRLSHSYFSSPSAARRTRNYPFLFPFSRCKAPTNKQRRTSMG